MRALSPIPFALVLAACGGDEPPRPAPVQQAAAPVNPPPGSAPGAPAVKLSPLRKIEEDVQCPPPLSNAKKCDPATSRELAIKLKAIDPAIAEQACDNGDYCLPTTAGYLCGPCPERDSIRHVFKDNRDFAADTNRDPFQSFIVRTPGQGSSETPRDPQSRCKPNEPIRASNVSFQDLRLVGIVAQGTQRKVLLMDTMLNYGHIIKPGDCVGKEKAYVRDIGENFVCFEKTQDVAAARPADVVCFELHTKQVPVADLPAVEPAQPRPTTITPVQPPPATVPGAVPPPVTPPPGARPTTITPAAPPQ